MVVCLNILFGFVKLYGKFFDTIKYHGCTVLHCAAFCCNGNGHILHIYGSPAVNIWNQSIFVSEYWKALTNFMSLVSFYTPWKHQKTEGFLMFSGGIEETSGIKWVKVTWNIGMEWGRYCRQIWTPIFSKFWSELINFKENRSQLIRLSSLNIRSEIWGQSLTWVWFFS